MESSIAVVGLFCILKWNTPKINTVISDTCGRVGTVAGANEIDKVYSLQNPSGDDINMNYFISAIIA